MNEQQDKGIPQLQSRIVPVSKAAHCWKSCIQDSCTCSIKAPGLLWPELPLCRPEEAYHYTVQNCIPFVRRCMSIKLKGPLGRSSLLLIKPWLYLLTCWSVSICRFSSDFNFGGNTSVMLSICMRTSLTYNKCSEWRKRAGDLAALVWCASDINFDGIASVMLSMCMQTSFGYNNSLSWDQAAWWLAASMWCALQDIQLPACLQTALSGASNQQGLLGSLQNSQCVAYARDQCWLSTCQAALQHMSCMQYVSAYSHFSM